VAEGPRPACARLSSKAVTPRLRIGLVVGAAAATAAVVAVGGALLQSRGEATVAEQPAQGPRAGAPPLLLDLGVRSDGEAAALRRATTLYDRGRRRAAARIFARFDSVNAEVGAALARWPDGSVPMLERLARANPRSALVRLNLGLALFWAGHRRQALAAWRSASRVEPDSASAVRAEDFLNPDSPQGLPIFVPSFGPPPSLAKLPATEQLAALARAAHTGGARAKMLYGIALQRLGRPRSAERQFAAAAALAPGDVEAQVAAAVGRFRKESPERAFSRLGPLARRYPREPTVRFHLGLLLLWLGEVEEARRQLDLARSAGPRTPLGREANRFLERLDSIRTG
jgi:tetratricopeptide (TPR) repeat protein